MKDNLLPFPDIKRSQPKAEKSLAVQDVKELERLRDAFAQACKDWPIEMAELPEENRKQRLS
jgi:hypothetical protein